MFSSSNKIIYLMGLIFISSCQILNPNEKEIVNTDNLRTVSNSADEVLTNEEILWNYDDKQFKDVEKFDQLSKYKPFNYEILFTNPKCGVYKYKTQIESVGGQKLDQKPENVYCKNQYDKRRSAEQKTSPQYRLIEWINNENTKEIFSIHY